MKKTLAKMIGLVAIAGIAFVCAHAADARSAAHAGQRRIAGGDCRDWFSGTATHRTGRFRNPNFAGVLGAYCSIPSDTELTHDKIVKLNVHGYNPSAMYSRTCVQYYNGSGATCSPTIGWDPGNGYKSLTGSYLSAWQSNPYHFPYLHSDVPGQGMIYGMWMHD